MELMTKAIQESLPMLYADEETPLKQKMVYVKYFSPYNGWTWYATEYDPESKIFFGLVQGFETEWGTFSLEEFEEVNQAKGFPVIERDYYFKPIAVEKLNITY
jgi:hypothetical protein